jgi:hypothetical protein
MGRVIDFMPYLERRRRTYQAMVDEIIEEIEMNEEIIDDFLREISDELHFNFGDIWGKAHASVLNNAPSSPAAKND